MSKFCPFNLWDRERMKKKKVSSILLNSKDKALPVKLSRDRLTREKEIIFAHSTNTPRRNSVMSNPKGWLEFGVHIPKLVGDGNTNVR